MSKLLLVALTFFGLSFQTICRDGLACPGTETCCKAPKGFGCCPYKNASCCADQIHCCPNGYACGTGYCQKSSANMFLDFVAEKTELATLNTPELEGTLNIKDLIKCIGDIKPFAADVTNAINSWKNGDKQAVIALLPKILAEGVSLGKDCGKVIQEIIG
jgi:hypothetical protein